MVNARERTRERSAVSVRRQRLVVRRAALEDVAVDRLGREVVKLRSHQVGLVIAGLGIETSLGTIDVRERRGMGLRDVTGSIDAETLVGERHVHKSLLRMISTERVHLLALQLVLDALAVGRVPDERKDRSDAFHKECSLGGLCIVQRGLDTVVPIRIPKQLLQACAIE